MVRRQVAVIATAGDLPPAAAAKAATTTIPIVFAVPEDPVKLGLVANFARPDSNRTGLNFFTGELEAKRLGLLREMMPAATRVALLINPANAANAETTLRYVEAAARVYPFLQTLFADAGYQGRQFHNAIEKILPHLQTQIVKRSDHAMGFVVLPKRWIVER